MVQAAVLASRLRGLHLIGPPGRPYVMPHTSHTCTVWRILCGSRRVFSVPRSRFSDL